MGKHYTNQRKELAKQVCSELDSFNKFFARLLRNHVFDAFSKKLEECRQFGEVKEDGLILLKLGGSVIDMRFMLETVCTKLKLDCIFVEEHTNPLDLVQTVLGSETLNLVHIQDNVSLNYLNRLLETFQSSAEKTFLIVTVRSNDSHVIRLDPSLAASIPVESFVFSDPEPLFTRFVDELILNYTRKTGLILSGSLLKVMRKSFFLEHQSFVELKNIAGMSLAKFGMDGHLSTKSNRVKQVVPAFEQYWILLEMFAKFLEQGLVGTSLSTLDVHINIQSDEDWARNRFDKANSYWSNAEKGIWLQFIDSCLERAQTFQAECKNGENLAEVLEKLNEIKEIIEQTSFSSAKEQMSKNIHLSPSRRKFAPLKQQTKKITEKMNELFSTLKPFEDYAIPHAQPKESNDDENLTEDHLPDFVKTSPYF
ncbi:hypothetical protein M3Y97_00589700 [Aphelenchoides bicaudatus]|nr:hypothetical protein M3Y97_00589700 [Aphelenchoides bicaudatus]